MRGAALALALALASLALLAGPLAAGAPMALGAWGAGVGTYTHDSASGTFVCPLAAVGFTHQLLGPSLTFRAGGAPRTFGQAGPEAAEDAGPCAVGTVVSFGAPDFTGRPEVGYAAHRVTDYGSLPGVTTEDLHIGPLGPAPVVVHYEARTVGGPAPSHWWVDAELAQTVVT